MSDLRITLELFGDRQLDREIRIIGRRTDNLNQAFRSIFNRMVDINSQNFWSHGARSGNIWESLKPATVAEKIREGSPSPSEPLRRFGDLFDAMSFIPNENNEVIYGGNWAVFRLTGEVADIGAIHQRGAPSKNLPARPFFAFTDEDREEFVREIQHFIFKRKVRNFL
jgi:phage gpG-like protein